MSEITKKWGVTEDTVTEESGSKFMSAGINENVVLTKLEYVADANNNYLQIEMEDKAGKTVSGRYYEPKIDNNIIKDAKDLDKKMMTFAKVLANLARKFLGEHYTFSGDTFTELCQTVINDIGDKYKGKPLRTKVVLNKKNFPILPAYAPIWEDPAVVPVGQSKLTINSIDKVKPTADGADAEPATAPATKSWV